MRSSRLSAIGDITRFPTAKQLVGYAGLGASVHASGQTYQTGHITRQGRKEMRAALEKRLVDLKKKQADGTITEQEKRRLERLEQALNRAGQPRLGAADGPLVALLVRRGVRAHRPTHGSAPSPDGSSRRMLAGP